VAARTDDERSVSVLEGDLRLSRLEPNDLVLVFSVGGGDARRTISRILMASLQYAKGVRARIAGVVGGILIHVILRF